MRHALQLGPDDRVILMMANGVEVEIGAQFGEGPKRRPSVNGHGAPLPPRKLPLPRKEREALVKQLRQELGPKPKIKGESREAYPEAYKDRVVARAELHGSSAVAEATGLHRSLVDVWIRRKRERSAPSTG